MTTETVPELLNQREVAKIIRKSEAWLERERWQKTGIPYRKIGRHVLYSRSDVLEFLNGCERFPVSGGGK